MRIVLLGDSHLARVRRDLDRLTCGGPAQPSILNVAAGGAFASDLAAQSTAARVGAEDRVAVSVGTNDAAPWKQVPLDEALGHIQQFLATVRPRRLVYLCPPGVDEDRLDMGNDRTDEVTARYSAVFCRAFTAAGARTVDAPTLLAPLGRRAFVADGVHLSGRGYDVILPALRSAVWG